MDNTPLQAGDMVELLAADALPRGQPPPPPRYGTVVSVDAESCRATVRLEGRHYPLDLPLHQLRRVQP
jgi:hypothetical protein